MDKIIKAFRALGKLARKPYLLNLVLDANENWQKYVEKNHYGLCQLPQLSLSELFGSFEESIHPFSFLDGGSLPTDLILLKRLAKQFDNCSYFEIGTWRGESVANVSTVASECFTMDLPEDEKRSLGMSEEYIRQYAILSRDLTNVTHLEANSLVFDFGSPGKKFDLVFIDGDHHYRPVLNDTQKVLTSLVHEKTVIVWHDYAYNPSQVRYEVLAAILDGIPPIMHSRLFHIKNTLCAVYFPADIGILNPTDPSFEVIIKCT